MNRTHPGVESALVSLAVLLSLLTVSVPVLETDGVPQGEPPLGLETVAYFTENVGQIANEEIRFYSNANGIQVGFAENSVLMNVRENRQEPARVPLAEGFHHETEERRGVLLRFTFEGSNSILPEGRGQLPHRNNFFLGSDPSEWRTGVRSFQGLSYREIYEGIDVIYSLTEKGLKYDFILQPGADPRTIKVSVEGSEGLRIGPKGELGISTSLGEIRDSAPLAYQGDGMEIPCHLVLLSLRSYGYDCPDWDGKSALTIDPQIYSTFVGGTDLDFASSIAVDSYNRAYVTGSTESMDFPTTPGAYSTSINGDRDVFVMRLNEGGSALEYSTYLGGSGHETGLAIAVSYNGQAFVVGGTQSADFPTTPGAYDTSHNGLSDWFVTKVQLNGASLVYSTLVGGAGHEDALAVDVDADGYTGDAYVTGYTESSDFPVTGSAYDKTHNGGKDVVLLRLSPDGKMLKMSTFLGGSNADIGYALDADSISVFVTGSTTSSDFPVKYGQSWDHSHNGGKDVFVSRLYLYNNNLKYSTFFGGSGDDVALTIHEEYGEPWIAGHTTSSDFPMSSFSFDKSYNGNRDAFVAKFYVGLNNFQYSTYLGGSGNDGISSLDLWPIQGYTHGHVFLTGWTSSTDFPDAYLGDDKFHNGKLDSFVVELGSKTGGLFYSSYFGGNQDDVGNGLMKDNSDCIYVAGATSSTNFPTTGGAYDTTHNGGTDAFVYKLDHKCTPVNKPPVISSFTATPADEGSPVVFTVTASDPDGDSLTYYYDFDSDNIIDLTSSSNSADHTWGDDYVGTATVRVSDGEATVEASTQVEVLSAPPAVSAQHNCTNGGPADILLRIAGEKWHDVTLTVFEDDKEIYNGTAVRIPGSPDDQIVGLEGFELNGSHSYSAVVRYTPEDDPVNGQIWGATPAWIILRSGGEEVARLNHTFNVRHPETWIWQVDDLASYVPERECVLSAQISDAGSDDLYVTWDWGDGTFSSSVHYNDGIGPDQYPSPDINPMNVMVSREHVYSAGGAYTVVLTVEDDDGGFVSLSLVVTL